MQGSVICVVIIGILICDPIRCDLPVLRNYAQELDFFIGSQVEYVAITEIESSIPSGCEVY
jgi:hypothetical protein